DRTLGRGLSGGIWIVVHDHAAREAAKKLDLRFGKAGSAARNDVADSSSSDGDRIHVTFYQDREIVAPQRLFGAIQVIENIALRIDRRLGRVQILRHVVAKSAAAKSDNFSGFVRDRKRDATAKAIEHAAVLAARD